LLKDLDSDNNNNKFTFERFSNSNNKARDIFNNSIKIIILNNKKEKSELKKNNNFIIENSYSDKN
jgi:hypothetical protein